ncbi:MAG: TVP38/TMEM64 family protein [Bacillota bacterium]
MREGANESSAEGSASPGTRASAGQGYRALFRRLGPAGILTFLASSLPFLGFALVVGTILQLRPWLQSQGWVGVLLYVVVFWVLGGLAVLPTWTHSALGGWTFGFALGLPAALLSYLGGSLIGYAIARRASGDRIAQLIREHAKWQAVYDALLGSGFWRSLLIVTLVRVPPSSPFAVTNVLIGSIGVGVVPFAVGTVVGIAPRTAFVVYTAATLQAMEFQQQNVGLIVANLATGAVAILVIVLWARRALMRFTEGKAQ